MSIRTDHQFISEWVSHGSRVLDLGCGDGSLLCNLIENKKVCGYGIEIDPDNIKKCITTGVNVIHGNIERGLSDFDNDSFDYVIMSQTLQALLNPAQLIEEMLRVGEQGIVTFPNFGYWRNRLQISLSGKMPVSKTIPYQWYDTPNIHLCTIKDFEKLCKDKNINIIQKTFTDNHSQSGFLLNTFPNLFGKLALYHFEKVTP
ncbi:MAG: methionine biosynthesis protein MetW [Methylococcales bacterium]|jgi:methionine biosynthesis protein MetW|nr:methionine biosynthesis protein MetW [Methylococcales bacterium]MBT7410224.1 methionine biosynthesis protein MetW [Methylococcales bacterium]